SAEWRVAPARPGAGKASRDPYPRPQAASTRIGVLKACVGPGNFAIASRRNPNAAAFETTPLSTADTSGDASRYASGSQPWNGNSGAFTANAATKPRKIQSLELVPLSTRSNVPCESPRTMIATSISNEPAI